MFEGDAVDDLVRRIEANDASLTTFGLEVGPVSHGRATVRMTVRQDLTNGHGVVHGGAVFALADTAFACAAGTVAPNTVTTDASIVYLSPGRLGEELVAEATVRHAGRRSLVDVTVRAGSRLVAEYRGRGTELRADRK
ncbi:PaaI family thioesterase [Streptomyces griseorubiginosus]|uniref:PaaI family thioesterase n=1 Tax=Streptomyces griseorubiginosus TaxID=67304 RepID=UPI00114078C4|nr:hotdog fold thioesterase [Streptomyces griseorubiginosus]